MSPGPGCASAMLLENGRDRKRLFQCGPEYDPDQSPVAERRTFHRIAPGATDSGRFEDYARRMYPQVVQMHVPTYIIGPALGDGPLRDRPTDILKIRPE